MNQVNLGKCQLQWDGKHLWLNSSKGSVLRVRAMGRVKVNMECVNSVAHSDIIATGNIDLCIPTTKVIGKASN